jgi:hypothetical protein
MRRRSAVWLAAPAALAAACEISNPPSGLSSISTLVPAWPAVVVNDTLRDSTGAAAPLHVDAFNGSGQPVSDFEVTFIALDTGLVIKSGGFVVGDRLRTSPARIVAQVRRGGDVLQTPEVNVDVVPPPDSVTPGADTAFAAKTLSPTDPTPVPSDTLAVSVFGRPPSGGTRIGVRSWVIRYSILKEPQGVNGQRTALFAGFGSDTVAFDTTNATGIAKKRTIVLQRALLAAGGAKPETILVKATIRDAGTRDAQGRPASATRTFTLPFAAP